jgi:hypothetical protein
LRIGKRRSRDEKFDDKSIEKPRKRNAFLKNISPEFMQIVKKDG